MMRHGQAAMTGGADAERPLTDTGRGEVRGVIARRTAELNPQVIACSPYRRARETAAIVTETLAFAGDLLISEQLTPDNSVRAVVKWLAMLDEDALMLVSHQPLIGELASNLTGDARWLAIQPGWLLALEMTAIAPGFAELIWLEAPGTNRHEQGY